MKQEALALLVLTIIVFAFITVMAWMLSAQPPSSQRGEAQALVR